MTQSTGYILAAIGPLLIGYLYDMTHVWTIPLIALTTVSVVLTVFGMMSGRNRYV
jgi:CP family cyanate transporter-like MFS transporter